MVTPDSERSPQTPTVLTFLTTWRLDPVALIAIVLAGGIYGGAIVHLRRRGHRWPLVRTLAFYLLGLGSYAWVSFGFLGAYSVELRWAFTTRIALLLFAVPALVTLGKPVALTRIVLSGMPLRMLNSALRSWPARLFGNAIFAPLFACAAFLVFLTPAAATLRDNAPSQWAITILVPLAGLLMVLPIGEHTTHRTSLFITAEFLFAFVEMVLDAIPGILLRLNGSVLDHAPAVVGSLPTWFPNPLHDQHLSGDFLWFIAEIVDVPVLVVLFMRWTRTDRREAKQLDDLSDEEMEALTLAHLRGGR
ncbi:MAG: cytochrome c oxidase assembly protein [Leifsonia sp.]|jgi:cytochrome c oxidase assembly factor CtaG|nr:cytochrome c oxidase assembly protein [Leifsonia sp.]MDQ1587462.1 putative rane protein [Microbacteriaceae bacterium]HEV7567666.1 cytochrome c oxidase assembly protein [Microbacteriaceae bacterium]